MRKLPKRKFVLIFMFALLVGPQAAEKKETAPSPATSGSLKKEEAFNKQSKPKESNSAARSSSKKAQPAKAPIDGKDPFEDPFGDEEDYQEPDPLEGMNRFFHDFNDFFYAYGFDPLARGYDFVVPELVRKGIGNFFDNLRMPVRLVSSLGQAKFAGAGRELGRFTINTTAGLGGFIDVASSLEIKASEEDVGQMFGSWGIGHGFYVVLPFFGPSSARDGFGLIGDLALTPTTYVPTLVTDNTAGQLGLTASIYTFQFVNSASLHLGEYEQLKDSSVDSYVLFRDIYLQNRAKKQKE